jgi:Acetyltransferase (GNAT) family.
MCKFILRPWKTGDEVALRAVWKAGFGDSDAYIDAFFSCFLKPGACLLAEADGRPVSAMYILEGPLLRPYRDRELTSAYTYALATLPAYRGRGIGAAVYRACCEAALSGGADAACVLPAEESLYPFYENAVNNRTVSAVREKHYAREDFLTVRPGICNLIGALEYAFLREELLAGKPHSSMPESYLLWQERLCDMFGGGLFATQGGVAAAEMDGDTCYIREFLDPNGDACEAAAAIATVCPAKEYFVRTPLFFDGPGAMRRFVLGTLKQEPDQPYPDDLWWGFAFD